MRKVTIGIVAHVDAGKTTITEQLLYQSGTLRQMGSVDEGTAQTDFLEVERQRGISVKASGAVIHTDELELNIIDTPGHVDFIAEVERSLSILDAAILVISAVEGIQAQTEILYEALRKTNTNVVFFINKIDRVGSNTAQVVHDIKEKFGNHVILCSNVDNEGEKTCNVTLKDFRDAKFFENTVELLCEQDEQLMEEYLSETPITIDKAESVFQDQMRKGTISPILCGSGIMGVGIQELLTFLKKYIQPTKNRDDNQLYAMVYKITHDKQMERIAHVRLFGGTLKNRDIIQLQGREEQQKITQIRKYNGSKFTDVGQATAGDVVALLGLSNAKIGDIIGEAHDLLHCQLAVTLLKVRVIPEKPEELYTVFQAFEEMCAEDPQLDMEYLQDEQELHISITGKIQLEILSAILQTRYHLHVTFSNPTVIYKETPTKRGIGFEAYTMPKPCWAVVKFEIAPLPRGSGLVYKSIVSNDKIYQRYQNHIEVTVPRALKQGMYNWEVTDLSVTLIDGEHHIEHTHPLDFFLATPVAIMDGLRNTGTTLLEPIQQMRIVAPEEYVGKLIGDIIAMRGMFDSPVIKDGMATMEAQVPVSASLDYAVQLASMTSGKAILSTRFIGYRECPIELGAVAKRRGINPLDRDKWILHHRNAIK